MEKLRSTVNVAVLSSGWDSPLILNLCNPGLSAWEWTDREVVAKLLLLSAIWASTLAEPNIPSKSGKVWVKISQKREGDTVAESKAYAEREIHDIGALKQAQRRRMTLSLSTVIPDTWKGEATSARLPVFWNLTRSNGSRKAWGVSRWETFWPYAMITYWTNFWGPSRALVICQYQLTAVFQVASIQRM